MAGLHVHPSLVACEHMQLGPLLTQKKNLLLARPYLTAVLPVLLCAGAAKLGDAEAVTKHLDEGKHVDEVVSRHTVKLQPKQERHRLDGSPVKLVTVSFMHALCLLSLVHAE